jgi:hypothetical protein
VDTSDRGKGLFQPGSKDDRSGLNDGTVGRSEFKQALMIPHIGNPGGSDFHGRILPDILMRKVPELVWFHAIAREKSMRFLCHRISRLIIVKHQNCSPGSAQNECRI